MTTSFLSPGAGRVLILHLSKGDDLLKSIKQGIEEAGIQSGIVVSGIGSLRKFRYHFIKDTEDVSTDIFETAEGPLELVSIQGLILEGKPHLHALVSEYGSKRHISGHLEEGGEVQYLAEIAILELKDTPLGRRTGRYGKVPHLEWLDGRV